MLQLRSLLLIRMFQSLYQHIGFLVAQDIPTYIFTKYGSITVHIQQIVFQLKSDTHIHAKVIQPFRIFSRSTAQQCSDFQTCRQQHGCFQTNHLQVFLLLHIAPLLKIHIHLLTFANFKSRQAEQIHHSLQMFGRTLRHKLISQHQHCVTRKDSRIIIPYLMHRFFSAAFIGTVHQVVMQQCIIMIDLDACCR